MALSSYCLIAAVLTGARMLSRHSNSLPPRARYSICSRDLSFELILLLFLQSSTFIAISVLPFQNCAMSPIHPSIAAPGLLLRVLALGH